MGACGRSTSQAEPMREPCFDNFEQSQLLGESQTSLRCSGVSLAPLSLIHLPWEPMTPMPHWLSSRAELAEIRSEARQWRNGEQIFSLAADVPAEARSARYASLELGERAFSQPTRACSGGTCSEGRQWHLHREESSPAGGCTGGT